MGVTPHTYQQPTYQAEAEITTINPLAAKLLHEELCRRYLVLPISFHDGTVTVLHGNDLDLEIRQLIHDSIPYPTAFAPSNRETVTSLISQLLGNNDEDDWIGDELIASGIATAEQIEWARHERNRTDIRLGDILCHASIVDESTIIALRADKTQIPVIDLDGYEPDQTVLAVLPEPLQRRLRVVPVAADTETLYIAVAEPPSDETYSLLRQHTNQEIRTFLTSANQIDHFLQRAYREQYSEIATSELLNRDPEDCANRVIIPNQKIALVVIAILAVAIFVLAPMPAAIGLMALASIFYTTTSLYKFKLTYDSLGHHYEIELSDAELAQLDDRDLPPYTILVPLYREAAVVPQIVEGIERLDYPKAKLDVRLLCEEDDDETIPAVQAMDLPPHFKLVVVPDSTPKTKPKACNYGLIHAEGEFVVIYDAEDRPDPQQLKKVVAAFRRVDPSVVCIQAKLNYFNANQNLLTRWFATEYSMWFNLLLPGLDASHSPIPLGGTSNHFVTDELIKLAAWDPYNVTEDADLGIRLHKAGFRTAMIDSTTLEEANSDVGNWIRQRSRWIKGYIQTYLVHMRHPIKLMRELGFGSWMSFQLLIGGTFILLLNPIFWGLTTLFFFTQAGIVKQLFPGVIFYAASFQLFIGNFLFMYLNVAGSIQRGDHWLAKYALLSPLYWGLMSIAAWKGMIQLIRNPFYWEKTIHGLDSSHPPANTVQANEAANSMPNLTTASGA